MPTFDDLLAQIISLLQRDGRVTYRALKRRFDLDDDYLADLTAEIIEAKQLAVDEDGKVLVWVGQSSPESRVQSLESKTSPSPDARRQTLDPRPIDYTPAHLAEQIRAVSLTEGERKTITALFADLKGSTALIESLDPEEARAIIDPALQLMMDATHQYEGYVAQALGDGIFALFGAPLAHEDHPQRALYAALRMQEDMRRYADTLRGKGYPPLLMRVGVNTGEVVLRSIRKDDLHADYVPVGHSTNLAARMEQLANPGTIVASAYTQHLTDGYFAFKDLGPTQIKGVDEPLHIYEVLGVGALRTRLQVAARRGLTRFVGRQSEMEQLNTALEQTKAGHGQIVGTMGEPGLGKSRLFHEFIGACGRTPLLVLQAYSVSHGKASPYLPVIELLKSYFQIQPQDDERTRRERVIGKVLGLDRSLEDTLPYLFALLGIEEQPSPLQQMDAQIRRRRTFEALKKLFLRESLNQPLILIFEDLHWIDTETQGFLDVLSESVASAKLLLLTNYRPEYRHEWGRKTYYTQLRLAPFGKAEAEEFLDVLLGIPVGAERRVGPQEPGIHLGAPLQSLKHLILDKTQGTPFFMEEIVQELVEQGVLVRDAVGAGFKLAPTLHSRLDLHIPPTVQGILAARIDRLAPDEKALLQQLSVIGRQFPVSLIRQVITQPEAELYQLLASLQHKEFLYEQPAFPESEYIFKHALTQEVAYGTVLQEQRKLLHERTGQALEALYAATLPEHYSDLAHHYRRSPNTEKAIEYLQKAGQQAVQRSANTEAVEHFITALELLKSQPDTLERARQELELQIALGTELTLTKGFGDPERERAFDRARELCQQLGETPQLFLVLYSLCQSSIQRGKLLVASEQAEQLMHLAQSSQDPVLLLATHEILGETLFWHGEFIPALEHFKRGTELYDPQQSNSLLSLYGLDLGILCQGFVTWALQCLGYPDQALKWRHEDLMLSQKLSHPSISAFILLYATWLHRLRQEEQLAQEQVEVLIALCSEQKFPELLAWGFTMQGWALTVRGQGEKGISQIRQGMAAWQAAGSEVFRSYWLVLLAEAYEKTGQNEEGLTTLTEALRLTNKNDERFYEAELYRIKGELTLQSKVQGPRSQAEAAEECFLKAIAIAQKQHAKSFELRAVISLARLWQQQGKIVEAHRMLSEVYHWFTEGFDTKDLQEAKTLLEELSH